MQSKGLSFADKDVVIADYLSMLELLACANKKIAAFANGDPEIMTYLQWDKNILSPAVQKYVKSQVVFWKQTLALEYPPPRESTQDRDAIMDEVFELILPRLDRELSGKPFLCG